MDEAAQRTKPRPIDAEARRKIQASLKMTSHTARRLRLDEDFRPERTKQETGMVDAVATRIAPSLRELQQGTPTSVSPAEDNRSPSPTATAPVAPEQDDAVILDLSEQAQAVLAQPNTAAPDAQAEKLAGLVRFEERFKLMTEYTALQQELAWLSDRTAAYALDKTFGGASAQQDQSGGEASERAEIDRDIQRREELMPRFAALTRKLRALPGQES